MSAPTFDPPRGRLPSIEWVHLRELAIDDSYQRSIETKASERLIGAIARAWDWDLLEVLKVSKRPDDRLFVIDGQHRKAAAALRGDIAQLPCVVKRCTGPGEEARLFIAANRGRRQMSRLDDFRAAVGAGDEEASTIQRLVDDAQLSIACSVTPAGQAPGELIIVAPLRAALKQRGELAVGQALRLIGEAFPDEVLVSASPLFGALVELLAVARLDYDRLFTTLLSGTTQDWASWAGVSTAGRGGQDRIIAMRAAILERYRTIEVAA